MGYCRDSQGIVIVYNCTVYRLCCNERVPLPDNAFKQLYWQLHSWGQCISKGWLNLNLTKWGKLCSQLQLHNRLAFASQDFRSEIAKELQLWGYILIFLSYEQQMMNVICLEENTAQGCKQSWQIWSLMAVGKNQHGKNFNYYFFFF